MSDTRSAAAIPPPKPVAPAVAADASSAMTLLVMLVATLYFGRDVLVPVTLALLLAFLLAPLVGLFRRARLGRVPSVLLGLFIALGIILAIGSVIWTQLAELSNDLPHYAATIETKVAKAQSYTVGRLSQLADRVGVQRGRPGSTSNAPISSQPEKTPQQASAPATSSQLDLVRRYLSPVLSPLATLGIVFIVAIFALLQQEDLRDRLIRLFGSDDLHRTTLAIDDGGRRLSKYFLTQFSVNVGFGIVVGVGLLIIGVPNPVLWGILSALLRFVPYVGSLISALLPMALAAAVDPGWSMVLWTAALYLVVEGLTGQIVEPMVYGHSTGLSPFAVVVAAIFWSWVWGPVGLILSTPLTLCLVVMGRHVRRLEFLDVMLGDRPALTPVESFYQRILAGDADEVQAQAELLLKDRSLSTYYDEVAVRGLQLAANDGQRGVLDAAQIERVKNTLKAVVESLQHYDDKQPQVSKSAEGVVAPVQDNRDLPQNPVPKSVPLQADDPHRHDGVVLCIAGRGPLDESASAMLVQLLGKHGMTGRPVAYEDVSREKIETLDTTGLMMACISYLDISGNPAHLRYLIQRLHRRLPAGTPILVGIWPSEDLTLREPSVRSLIGADCFTTCLGEAVSSCVEVALKPTSSVTPQAGVQ